MNAFTRGNLGSVERALRRALAALDDAQRANLSTAHIHVADARGSLTFALDDLERAIRLESMTESA